MERNNFKCSINLDMCHHHDNYHIEINRGSHRSARLIKLYSIKSDWLNFNQSDSLFKCMRLRRILLRTQNPRQSSALVTTELLPNPVTPIFMGEWSIYFNHILESHIRYPTIRNKFVEDEIANCIGDGLERDPTLKVRLSGKLRSVFQNLGVKITSRRRMYSDTIRRILKKRKFESRWIPFTQKNKNQTILIQSATGETLLSIPKTVKWKKTSPKDMIQEELDYDKLMAEFKAIE